MPSKQPPVAVKGSPSLAVCLVRFLSLASVTENACEANSLALVNKDGDNTEKWNCKDEISKGNLGGKYQNFSLSFCLF